MKKLSVHELVCMLNIFSLDSIHEANRLDLCFSCLGVDPLHLTNEQFLEYLNFFEHISEKLCTPIRQNEQFAEFMAFSDLTKQPFVKYYVFEKTVKKKLKNFELTEPSVIFEFLSIFLDTKDEKGFNQFKKRENEQKIAETLCATDVYRLYYYILEQINGLKALYPYYFTSESGSGNYKTPSEAKFYSNYALELQIEYIAKLNHCAVSDVYLYPIHDVMLHISILNQKNTIENEKISRNH